ncbi:MAG: CopD family protein [Deltaproteobacteria bacterium]|nr:CopD family protein [Deltaproteobacteria bacterium]
MVHWLRALHLLSLMFWIGSLLSITRVVASGEGEAEAVRAHAARLARKLYRVVASPWMGMALLTGLGLLSLDPRYYLRHGWFHGKLTAALGVLAVHFLLGTRVRKAEAQGLTDDVARSMRALQLGALLLSTVAVVFIVVWKGLRPG